MPRGYKRLAYSLAVVLVWLSFVVEGSHALIVDGANLTGNTISIGSTDLQVSNSQSKTSSTFADSRPGFATTLNPGQTEQRYIFLKNASTSSISMELSVMVANLQVSDPAMAEHAYVNFTPVDGDGNPSDPTGMQESGGSFTYLPSHPLTFGPILAPGATQRFKLTIGLDDQYLQQNQTLTYDLIFTGTQHAS